VSFTAVAVAAIVAEHLPFPAASVAGDDVVAVEQRAV